MPSFDGKLRSDHGGARHFIRPTRPDADGNLLTYCFVRVVAGVRRASAMGAGLASSLARRGAAGVHLSVAGKPDLATHAGASLGPLLWLLLLALSVWCLVTGPCALPC